jgi:predicted nucleotide-binding protein (sugar kinase/HSP70/actin superfamily)
MSRKIIIKESELVKLIEVAMDLDIYSQEHNVSTGDGNEDAEDSINQIIDRLKELLNMLQAGKKVDTTLKGRIYKNLDDLNKTFSSIKYQS